MKQGYMAATLFVVALVASGCAHDPLTRTLKKNGYAPIPLAPATVAVGDIYESKGFKELYVSTRDRLSDYIGEVMESIKDDVSIPDTASESEFNISAEVDLVGGASAELSAEKISKFKVSFRGVTQYVISKTRFEDEVYLKIKEEYPGRSFDKKFVVTALLRVAGLEYEFYDKKGGKVSVDPGSKIEQVLKAKLGGEWSGSESGNLTINSPRFIGYRMGQLSESSYTIKSAGGASGVEVIAILPEELRKAEGL
ncbi:MAG: hypothetical protein ACOZBW_05485 [Thermodesulfobacteriota bacterium]